MKRSTTAEVVLSRRLSIPELSEQVLQMSKTGVYRESVFEALQPLATKQQIRRAIAHAKRFGLHSVPSLRDPELGTYYQLDDTKYQTLKHRLHAPESFGDDADLVQRVTQTTQTVQRMLLVAQAIATGLGCFSVVSGITGHWQVSLALGSSTIAVAGLWAAQRWLSKAIAPAKPTQL
jgi:hypothetical protein